MPVAVGPRLRLHLRLHHDVLPRRRLPRLPAGLRGGAADIGQDLARKLYTLNQLILFPISLPQVLPRIYIFSACVSIQSSRIVSAGGTTIPPTKHRGTTNEGTLPATQGEGADGVLRVLVADASAGAGGTLARQRPSGDHLEGDRSGVSPGAPEAPAFDENRFWDAFRGLGPIEAILPPATNPATASTTPAPPTTELTTSTTTEASDSTSTTSAMRLPELAPTTCPGSSPCPNLRARVRSVTLALIIMEIINLGIILALATLLLIQYRRKSKVLVTTHFLREGEAEPLTTEKLNGRFMRRKQQRPLRPPIVFATDYLPMRPL